MPDPTEYAPGVTYTPCICWDTYSGTDADILSCGLVKPEHLPGAPGNGKTSVTFLASGERARKGDSGSAGNLPGRTTVRRRSPRLLLVEIRVSRDAAEVRRAAYWRDRDAAEARARAWPFPVCIGRPV